jgi:hypothetical protein
VIQSVPAEYWLVIISAIREKPEVAIRAEPYGSKYLTSSKKAYWEAMLCSVPD